jgi:hypothetical protein
MVAMAFARCSQATAPGNTMLTPDAHSLDYFNITSGSHANLDCNVCHGGADSFAQYSCTSSGCHDQPSSDAAHVQITSSYTWSPTSCYQCHSLGTNLTFDHTNFFPIRSGDVHAAIACGSCHPDPTNHKAQDCLTCHPPNPTDGFHVNVGGYARTSSVCLSCHADSKYDPIAKHAFVIDSTSAGHFLTPCLSCHPNMRTDEPWGIDFTTFDCLGCHSQASLTVTGTGQVDHSTLASYTYADPSCIQSGCHLLGTLTGQAPKRWKAHVPPRALASLVDWLWMRPLHARR